MGADYLYKVQRMPGSYKVTKQLALELLHSKDVYDKASDALKVVLDMNQELDKEERDCQKMLKLLLRAQADADTRAFSPIASLNSKRGCGDNKLKDCWDCLRDGDGKKALADAIKLARKNKAPL
jgi:putative heme degradation protein